jgi:hypothetical protein
LLSLLVEGAGDVMAEERLGQLVDLVPRLDGVEDVSGVMRRLARGLCGLPSASWVDRPMRSSQADLHLQST